MKMKKTLNDWMPFLKKEAELGNPDAMSILARMHRDGFGAPKNQELVDYYTEMEKNASPFELDNQDIEANPWAGQSVDV